VSWRDPGVSLTTEDGWYLGNVVEPVAGDDVAGLDEALGEVVDGDVVVLVGVTLTVPQPATSPTARTVTNSNPISPDGRTLFIAMPPVPEISPKKPPNAVILPCSFPVSFSLSNAGISLHGGKYRHSMVTQEIEDRKNEMDRF
jgi:hypothetical protein